MEYSIGELAKLAGITTRTLRYYDRIGLLKPGAVRETGYRRYGEREVDLLQQILFYRSLGVELAEIARMINADNFDRLHALRGHLSALHARQAETARLIETVKKTIASIEGGTKMADQEKFEAFKARVVRENEQAYGAEARQKYGDADMDASNAKLLAMTEADYERFQTLGAEILRRLEQAVQSHEPPEGDAGQRITAMHKSWLGMTWRAYSAEAHRGLAEGYVADERFTAYYDQNVKGCAAFLRDAVAYWAK